MHQGTKIMNEFGDMFWTTEIGKEKPNAKHFFRFVGTFEEHLSSQEVIVNSHIRMTLVKQPLDENVSTLKPKDKVLVFAQVIEENKSIEGQIRKLTLEQALRFENLIKKQLQMIEIDKLDPFDKRRRLEEMEKKRKAENTKNGGFIQHF